LARVPKFKLEKVALFCNPASEGTFSSTAIENIKWVQKIAVAQAKVSHILRPGNTAFKEQLKLVNGFERWYRRIHALKKKNRQNKTILPFYNKIEMLLLVQFLAIDSIVS
jgi:hypothetical protein